MYQYHYPVLETKVCPKDFNCSNCGKTVKARQPYIKTNHGRYCMPCKDTAQAENKHTEFVSR
jgi:hypothetical protein